MEYQSLFFVLRTPLLPLNNSSLLFDNAEEIPEILQKHFKNPLLQEAIFLASPVLYQQLLKYLNQEITDKKKKVSLEESLLEYFLRMSSRCTPFGLFAGITVGTFGMTNTADLLSGIEPGGISRHLRLDTNVLSLLVNFFNASSEFKSKTRFFVNSSVYRLGKKIRYVEYKFVAGKRIYEIKEVDFIPVLDEVLKKAKSGLCFNEALQIITAAGFATDDSIPYLNDIIDSQLLLTELEPSVIGEDFFNYLVAKAKEDDLSQYQYLEQCKTLIDEVNQYNDGVKVYEGIIKILEAFDLNVDRKDFFQVDLNRVARTVSLTEAVRKEIFEAASVLFNLNQYNLSDTNLEAFKQAFLARYELEPVRLVDALDIETGINYKRPQDHFTIQKTPSPHFIALQNKYKHYKYQEFLKNDLEEIIITDDELARFNINTNGQLPLSFNVMAKILDNKANLLQVQTISGPSFTKLFGRFCNSDAVLNEMNSDLLKEEEKLFNDSILAEVVHLPEAKLGNVLNRPHLSAFEIPYLGKSRLPDSQQISIDDLYLRMEKNKLVLFSKRLNKEVIPRLSSAHNFSTNSLPIYHFLCDMQSQLNQSGGRWFWSDLDKEEHLPRVRYKNTILAAASWKISFEALVKKGVHREKKELDVQALIDHFKILGLPKYVYYCLQDNKLIINAHSEFGAKYLFKKITKNKFVELQEVLFDLNNLLVKSPDGGYTNEIIIPFVKQIAGQELSPAAKAAIPVPKLKRRFEPGSEWVYYKVYCGVKSSNSLLTEIIYPLAVRLLKGGIIKSWFFIRYRDPGAHLRIRFRLTDKSQTGYLVAQFSKALNYQVKNALVWGIQQDTYTREIERYDEQFMELAEEFFFRNSMFICEVFRKFSWDDKNFKFQIAFKAIYDFLNILFDNNQTILELVNVAVNGKGLGKNSNNKLIKDRLNLQFRHFSTDRNKFEAAFSANKGLQRIFEKHNIFIKEQLRLLTDKRQLDKVSSNRVLISYMHMFVNRLFEKSQNEVEGEVYYYLEKHYISVIAKEKKTKI